MSEVAQVSPMPESMTQAPIPAPEVAPVADAATEAPKELDSARWAAIAKKEQRMVHQQQALKKREEEIALLESQLKEKLTPFQEFEIQRSKDPVAALRGLGFSETDIFNWLAQSEKKELTPEEKAEAAAQKKIEEFKKEQAEKEAQAKQAQDKEVITRFKGRIKSFLSANKDKYEACADYGEIAEDAAYRLIEQIAKDTGEVISLDEAFQAHEDFYTGEYERMSKYKKFQKKEEVAPAPEEKKIVSRTMPQKTLTNAATQTIASTVPKNETREQKRERLINMLKESGLRK